MTDKESALWEALITLCEVNGIEGHLLLYLDGSKVRMVGNIETSALAPILPSLFKKLVRMD